MGSARIEGFNGELASQMAGLKFVSIADLQMKRETHDRVYRDTKRTAH